MNLYNLVQWIPDVLDTYSLPDNINRDILNQAIMIKCGASTLLWDTPSDNQYAIKGFFARYYNTFKVLADISALNYNPLQNRDIWETGVDNTTHTGSLGKNDNSTSHQSSSGNTENTVSAYNADIYSPDNNAETTASGEATYKNQTTQNTKDVTNKGNKLHSVGNTGILYQDFIKKEREVRDYTLYDIIADRFERDICLLVY